jgi:hypothetical protein
MRAFSRATAFGVAYVRLGSLARIAGLTGLAVLATLTPSAAKEGEAFLCDIVPSGKVPDAFPEMVGISVGSDQEGTFVVDPIINYYYGGPIQADVVADNGSRLSIRWSVKVTSEDTGRSVVTLFYDMLVLKANLKARVRLKARGDSLEFLATGTCERG